MDLVSQVEDILRYEGLKPKTRDAALRETFSYYQGFLQRMIDVVREGQKKGRGSSENHLAVLEQAQTTLKDVIKGKTTYQKEWSKVEKDLEKGIERREHDLQYRVFEWALTFYVFRGYFDEIERQAEMLDKTIQRLYLQKKKKRSRDPELWRTIL